MASAATQRIRVAARIRPLLSGEQPDDFLQLLHGSDSSAAGDTTCIVTPAANGSWTKFPFTSCYDATSTQEEIYSNDVLPLIDELYKGITVTVFAYGVTSSGKTHTMQGSKAQPGIIPRTVRELFSRKSEYTHLDISISMSYMEIYKDEVYDLLVPRDTAQKLPVREDGHGIVFVSNLTWTPILSIDEFESIYGKASKQRSVGSTKLNNSSSRSHAILSLQVSLCDSVENKTTTGKVLLVDLAGSENNKMTGNDATRMQESSAINKSLSVLGQVVRALNKNETRIPYRDSKLTRILQPALGGDSLGLLICNLAPGNKLKKDTLNTLNFASIATSIENRPSVNETSNLPPPKPHFAALNNPTRKSIVLQPTAGSNTTTNLSNLFNNVKPPAPSAQAGPVGPAGIAPAGSRRPSFVPRYSRLSSINGFQPFAFGGGAGGGGAIKENNASGASQEAVPPGLSEKEIEERIAKAVEAEVQKRLGEIEKERELKEEEVRRQREEREAEEAANSSNSGSSNGSGSGSTGNELRLPAGVLTPLLKQRQDIDEDLRSRLSELEGRYRASQDMVTQILSPVSRKKAGRAYVALARTYSSKGDLQVALDLYRKAEAYVPDNIKLKERIIDIEYSVKNGKEFVPSPKRPKKIKTKAKAKERKRGSKGRREIEDEDEQEEDIEDVDHVSKAATVVRDHEGMMSDEQMEVDEVAQALAQSHPQDDEITQTPRRKRGRESSEEIEEIVNSTKRRKGVEGEANDSTPDRERRPLRRSPRKRVQAAV